MSNLFGDLRVALRTLARTRALTALAVLTLALGIGANTAIFSVINAVLLAPLPYPDAERLVQVWNTYPMMGLPQASVSIPDYFDRRTQAEAFADCTLYRFESFNLAAGGPPERVIGVRATAPFFSTLQSDARLGRVFTEDEDQPGRENVVVIAHGLWQRAFGGDPGIVDRAVRLNGETHQVLGVMPPDFAFPSPRVQIWKPFAPTPEQMSDDARGNEFSNMLARLAPGASLAQAQQQIDAIHERNKERFPDARTFWESSGFGGLAIPLREERFSDLRPMLLLLQGVVLLVLLIACANVANLLLTRLSRRRKELAVRTALGAGRWRLARQLLTESLLLAFLGGALGVAFGAAGLRILAYLGVDPSRDGVAVGLDPRVLLFTAALALATGVLFSLVPLISMWRTQTGVVLKEGGDRGSSGGPKAARPRNLLVVAEMAMALVLLVGAGLLVRTFAALQDEDPGFNGTNVLTASVELPRAIYGDDPPRLVSFYEQALEQLRAIPGVEQVGLISNAPFSGNSASGSYRIEGYEAGPGESSPHSLIRMIDEDYLRTMEIPLVAGRGFQRYDDAEAEGVLLIDQTLVDKYWPGESGIGKRLRRGGSDSPWLTVVGVVAPVKITSLDRPVSKETIYMPYRQRASTSMTFVLKTRLDPGALQGPLRDAVLAVDPEQPVFGVTTMSEQIAGTLVNQRVSMVLLVSFGGLAVVLALIGIYGVLAFTIAQRVRELGTRMALGAEPRHILGLVIGQGMALTLFGVALGTVASLLLGRLIASRLFGVAAWDPATFGAVTALLVGFALLACYRPARRASRIDPLEALRDE